jgi:hypothetical protein
MKSGRIIDVEHVACTAEKINAYRGAFIGECE